MNKNRIEELDVLRGIAALSVILFHYTSKYDEVFTPKIFSTFEFKYGYLGVQLFFIISGFVIFMTINKVKSGKEFVYKRFIRLYPTFWICLFFTFLITSFANIERFERSITELLINITMVPDLFKTKPIDGAYWSLLPEIIFYSFIWLIYKLKLINKIEWIGLIWIIISLLLKIYVKNDILNLLFITDYAYLFVAGINFYKIYVKQSTILNHIIIIIALITSYIFNDITESILCTAFFCLFYLLSFNKLIGLKKLKPLVFVGVISYALYLTHQFFGLILINKLSLLGVTNYYILLLTPLLISIFIAWIITVYLDKLVSNLFKKVLNLNAKN